MDIVKLLDLLAESGIRVGSEYDEYNRLCVMLYAIRRGQLVFHKSVVPSGMTGDDILRLIKEANLCEEVGSL